MMYKKKGTTTPIDRISRFHEGEPASKDYYHLLKAQCEKQDVAQHEFIQHLPELYKLLCRIERHNKTPWPAKILVNAALSYFVIDEDIIPDNQDDGLLDDLFVCVHVLKEIRDKVSKKVIIDNIQNLSLPNEDDSIFELIYDIYNYCSVELGRKRKIVLDLVGLSSFDSLDLLYSEEQARDIINRRNKIKLLYAMLAVKCQEIISGRSAGNNKSRFRKERFHDYIIGHPEYSEIKRYMEFTR